MTDEPCCACKSEIDGDDWLPIESGGRRTVICGECWRRVMAKSEYGDPMRAAIALMTLASDGDVFNRELAARAVGDTDPLDVAAVLARLAADGMRNAHDADPSKPPLDVFLQSLGRRYAD